MNVLSSLRRSFTPGNVAFYAVFAVLSFLFCQCFSILTISGHSMDPTLEDRQIMIGLSARNNPLVEVSGGDIVVIDCPQLDCCIVKRIVGMPGDRLQLKEGQLYINGALQHEPYIYEPMLDDSYGNTPEMTVPEGHYFVMGDNRNISLDSRSIGFISQEQIRAMAFPHHQALLTLAFLGAIFAVILLPYCVSSWFERKADPADQESVQSKKELQAAA